MKLKKWFLAIAAFAVMAVVCAVGAGAEWYRDYEYDELADGSVEIAYYFGNTEKNVDIPEKMDGKSVTSIGSNAFGGHTNLVNVTIPNSVKNICNDAFSGCTSLTSVTIPNGLTSIGEAAFSGCTSLTSITIPDSVKSIGDEAFSGCTSLKSITIPNGVNEVSYCTFYGCRSLTSVSIPDSVTGIYGGAFSECESLTSIALPNSVTVLEGSAFYGCSNLTSINIPNGVTSIGWSAFSGCTSLSNITLPSSVKSIGYYAFMNCTSLKSIKIPDNVTNIGWWAFSNCRSLTSVTIPERLNNIGAWAFSGCSSLTGFKVSAKNLNYVSVNGVLYNKDKTVIIQYPAGKKDKSYKIPDGVAIIAGDAFKYSANLTSITIPDSVEHIGDSAFYNCASLTSITIPKDVTNIGDQAFRGCISLTEIKVATANSNFVSLNGVLFSKDKTTLICYPAGKKDKSYTIPDGVTNIYWRAFSDCTSLTSITIPKTVTDIGSLAFCSCISLTEIKVAAGNPNFVSLNGILFSKNKTALICYPAGKKDESYTIPDGVTSIYERAFSDCTSLKRITIPDGMSTIGGNSFFGCANLTSVTIPGSVIDVAEQAFGYHYDGKNFGSVKYDNFKIYCYNGTAGEKYAKKYGFKYGLLIRPILAEVMGTKLSGRAADALCIDWTKNANATGYIVEMYQNGKWTRVGKIIGNGITTFRKAGLKASTVYKFRVKVYKMYGRNAYYGAYSATVTARTNPSVVKGAKLGGRAADALRINWTKNASADGYIVEMYQGNKWVRIAKITNNNTTTFRKAGLKASTVYKFRVRVYKMSGKTALYGNYSATVTARTNPSIVKCVKIGGKAKDALRVNWAKNTSAQGYIVEMYKGGKWVRVAKITNGNTTTFRKAGLAKNTAYKFRVKAYYMSGKTALYGNYGSVSGKTAAK